MTTFAWRECIGGPFDGECLLIDIGQARTGGVRILREDGLEDRYFVRSVQTQAGACEVLTYFGAKPPVTPGPWPRGVPPEVR